VKKIVIAGTSVYGIENQGDEALLSVLCRELHRNIPDLEITLLARHPSRMLDELYGVKSIHNLEHRSKKESLGRWFMGLNPGDSPERLRKIRKAIEECDLLIIGGDPFAEITMAFYRGLAPYAALLITLSKFFEKPSMLYCIHMGRPLKTELGKELTKFCVTNSDLVTLREEFSRKVLVDMGMGDHNTVVLSDSAFGLDPIGDRGQGQRILEKEGIRFLSDKVVGFNFRHQYWTWSDKDWERYRSMLGEACDHMVETLGVDLLFIPNCTYDIDHKYEDDRPVHKEIVDRMRHRKHAHQVTNKYNLYETLSLFPFLDMHFSNRRHSLIFAAIHGVPPVACGGEWHIKPAMVELSLGDKFIPIENLSADLLKQRIDETWKQCEGIKERISEVLPGLREQAVKHAELAADLIG
jgi:polysaccharide pyruvyl transferase WcaK-like protein